MNNRFMLYKLLLTQQQRTGQLSHDEVVQIVFLLLVAGNATVVSMIALVRLHTTYSKSCATHVLNTKLA
jgi:cytochrome P450